MLVPTSEWECAAAPRAIITEGGVVSLSSLGFKSIVIGLFVLLVPNHEADAATADELREALGAVAGGQSGELVLASGAVALPDSYAESAAEVVSEGQIRLSSGLAENSAQLANTDFGLGPGQPGSVPGEPDGEPDILRFTVSYGYSALAAPTLVLTSQFLTEEFGEPRTNNDFAELRVSWLENGIRRAPTIISLGDVNSSFSTQNPRITTRVNIEGLAGLELEFVIADAVDGSIDSALIISELYFSGLPTDGDQVGQPDGSQYPQDVNLANGTFSFGKSLIRVPGIILPFDFSLSYNSGWDDATLVGEKWTHSYHWLLEPPVSGTEVRIRTGGGVSKYFEHTDNDPTNLYRPKFGANDSTLVYSDSDLTWLYVTKSQVR